MKTTEQKIEELEKQLQELKNEVANQNQPKFKNKDWNAERCEIVDYRWRAKEGELYYYVFSDGTIDEYRDEYCVVDDTIYNLGNYFKTK